MGIQSYTLRNFPADAMLDLVRRLGLTRVETYPAHFEPRSTPAQIEAMKKKTAERNIQINACGVIGFGRDVAANRRVFQFAKAAGIRNISADPSPDAFDSLDKLVEEFDIRIAIHNHGPGARYNKIDSVLKAIKGHHQSIGACADLGHYIRAGENPVDAIEQFKGRLYGVHLKDFAEAKGNARGVILGRGKLDLVGVFKALKEVQFPADGALSLEYEENPKNPIDDVKACLAAASEGAKKAAA
ncbi:MAG: sugar phosphate isomerase/epimerase [Planctomycetia bacterium]|nr:sugar phosphate isomerase/epimerase [Planctomycetia bacterium]